VDLAAVHDETSDEVFLLDRLALRRRRLAAKERDHVGLPAGTLPNGFSLRRAERRSPRRNVHLQAEACSGFSSIALEVGGETTRLEDDVAARDVGRDVLEAELLEG
jgi:hypothetical protein